MISKEVREIINTFAKITKKAGGLISFDPNIRVELLQEESLDAVIGTVLGLTDILIPGERELIEITGKRSIDEGVKNILDGNVSTIVLKRGKKGARLIDQGHDITVEPFQITEVDPTGAGDAFDAGFVCGYLEDLSPERCLVLANGCGALTASYFGPMEGVFHREYVDYFIKRQDKG